MMKGIYSSNPTCRTSYKVICQPCESIKGKINKVAQNADILPKLWCQKSEATKGNIAIDRRIPAKGTTQRIERSPPSK